MTKNNESVSSASEGYGTEPLTECESFRPSAKYESLLFRVYKNTSLYEMLRILCVAIVFLTLYAYLYSIATSIFAAKPLEALRLLTVTAPSFFVVSAVRRIINAPRPYEILPFYEKAPKGTRGRSFPSRHVFSVFVIGTALTFTSAPVGIAVLLGGVILSVCRVLLGIHFIKDTVAGAVIGAISGVVGMLITGFFF